MAIYHFSAKVFQRSAGRSAVAAAAYRAAARIFDERIGRTYDYSSKPGVIHSEVLLPDGAPARWRDRSTLWNEVEALERRKDAQLAREIELSLPRELSSAEVIALARDFVCEQFVAQGMVADLNIHWGVDQNGDAQPHAHVMLSMRSVIAGEGFGQKQRAWNDRALLRDWREAWETFANARLAEAGHDVRIDHRSYVDQGVDLAPQNKIGPAGARRAVRGEDAERTAEHRAIARRNGERLLAEPDLALSVLTRSQSTFTREELAKFIHRHTDGADQFSAVLARVEASPEKVLVGKDGRGRERFSTREMVAIERRMITAARTLNNRTTHGVDLEKRRAAPIAAGLRDEQTRAFHHVTRARDLAVVCGVAGGGKSTLFSAARQVWEEQGYRVRGAALSGIAAEGLENSAGIESRTLASWEYAWAQGKEQLSSKDVLVVDEAGMIGSRQLGRLIETVEAAGAKLVLSGDWRQLQAIESGAALRAIAERVGSAEIVEPQRQHDAWQREATKELASGRIAAALQRYEAARLVSAHDTLADGREAIILDWGLDQRLDPHRSRIMLTHTRDNVRALNEGAREMLHKFGQLGPDHVMQTGQGARAFAEGERIYFLRNDRGLGVKNGTLGTLERIEGSRLTVRLDADGQAGAGRAIIFDLGDYGDIDHGYAATVHKSQGATVDVAHVLATRGMDRHLAYVALSRHRSEVRLHWSADEFGTREAFAERLGRERAKDTSLDYGLEGGADAEQDARALAAYAEERGLVPAPSRGSVAAPTGRAPFPHEARVEEIRSRLLRDPDAPRRRLSRPPIEKALRKVLPALERAIERQTGAALEIGYAVSNFGAKLSALRKKITMEAARSKVWRSPAVPPPPPRMDYSKAVAKAPPPPLIAAIPETAEQDSFGRGWSEKAVVAVVDADEGVTDARARVAGSISVAYKDPAGAELRLKELEQELGAEGVLLALDQRGGLKQLGELKGAKPGLFRLFEDIDAKMSRKIAEHYGEKIGPLLVEQRQRERDVAEAYLLDVIEQRGRDKIEIPGLSPPALEVLFRLHEAGCAANVRSSKRSRYLAEAPLAAKASALWSTAGAEAQGELKQFAAAVDKRFPKDGDGPEAPIEIRALMEAVVVVRNAVTLHEVHQDHEAYERKVAQWNRRAAPDEDDAPAPRARPGPSPGF